MGKRSRPGVEGAGEDAGSRRRRAAAAEGWSDHGPRTGNLDGEEPRTRKRPADGSIGNGFSTKIEFSRHPPTARYMVTTSGSDRTWGPSLIIGGVVSSFAARMIGTEALPRRDERMVLARVWVQGKAGKEAATPRFRPMLACQDTLCMYLPACPHYVHHPFCMFSTSFDTTLPCRGSVHPGQGHGMVSAPAILIHSSGCCWAGLCTLRYLGRHLSTLLG